MEGQDQDEEGSLEQLHFQPVITQPSIEQAQHHGKVAYVVWYDCSHDASSVCCASRGEALTVAGTSMFIMLKFSAQT